MKIKSMSLGPLGTNCYIIYHETNALIVDPGGNATEIINFLHNESLIPQAILLTHAHFDHIGAVDTIRSHFNIEVHLHENEADWLEDPYLNRSAIYAGEKGAIKTRRPEKILQIGKMHLSSFTFEVVHTPGHSPGSVSFIFYDEKLVISGDVLFRNGIGRTDLVGGSIDQLLASIRTKLFQLPEIFTVYPGHGIETTIGEEKRTNPYTQ